MVIQWEQGVVWNNPNGAFRDTQRLFMPNLLLYSKNVSILGPTKVFTFYYSYLYVVCAVTFIVSGEDFG